MGDTPKTEAGVIAKLFGTCMRITSEESDRNRRRAIYYRAKLQKAQDEIKRLKKAEEAKGD